MLFVILLIVNIVCTYMCMWAHSAMTKVCKSEVNFAESVFFYFDVRSRDHQLVCYFCIITKFCRHDVMLMVTSTWEAETRKRVAVSTTWRCVLGGLCVWCLELNVYAFTSLFYHWAICSALKVEQLELRTQSGASHPQWTFPPAMAQPCYLSWIPHLEVFWMELLSWMVAACSHWVSYVSIKGMGRFRFMTYCDVPGLLWLRAQQH